MVIDQNCSAFYQIFLGGVVKTCFDVSVGKILKTIIVCERLVSFFFFGRSLKVFWSLGKKFQAGLSKLPSTYPSGQFEETLIFGKISYFQSFFGSWARNFYLPGEHFWRFCQICVLRVCKTVLVKVIIFEKFLLLTILFAQCAKKLRLVSKNFLRCC